MRAQREVGIYSFALFARLRAWVCERSCRLGGLNERAAADEVERGREREDGLDSRSWRDRWLCLAFVLCFKCWRYMYVW